MKKLFLVALYITAIATSFAVAQSRPVPCGPPAQESTTEKAVKMPAIANESPRVTGDIHPGDTKEIVEQLKLYDRYTVAWFDYREKVAVYLNHPTYTQWAKTEYERSNKAIQTLQGYKSYYYEKLSPVIIN